MILIGQDSHLTSIIVLGTVCLLVEMSSLGKAGNKMQLLNLAQKSCRAMPSITCELVWIKQLSTLSLIQCFVKELNI